MTVLHLFEEILSIIPLEHYLSSSAYLVVVYKLKHYFSLKVGRWNVTVASWVFMHLSATLQIM